MIPDCDTSAVRVGRCSLRSISDRNCICRIRNCICAQSNRVLSRRRARIASRPRPNCDRTAAAGCPRASRVLSLRGGRGQYPSRQERESQKNLHSTEDFAVTKLPNFHIRFRVMRNAGTYQATTTNNNLIFFTASTVQF
ncbi:hypothetical protein BGLA2_1660010 [Burkholderia gladioli]|nr:hypothetical protein BGLA2_1660010 [Burkholderia gladioli]